MADLAELTAWRDALRKARASGIRRVQHGETATDYKSDSEMAAALADLDRQIAAASGAERRSRIVYINSKKGT